ncbi:hypothetical protein RRG08_054463 [Elysia crispata]|uniref:Uncharacterized protein n=1 Tax=Elysia crispata TaxID=231223 RepID=A0AAE1CU49_9GAST|nr:hypothetical protein RRG08_054463 [Elysia crispata]
MFISVVRQFASRTRAGHSRSSDRTMSLCALMRDQVEFPVFIPRTRVKKSRSQHVGPNKDMDKNKSQNGLSRGQRVRDLNYQCTLLRHAIDQGSKYKYGTAMQQLTVTGLLTEQS